MCQWCGPNIYCKIDKAGTYVALTMPQRRAWANALACFDFVNQCLANIDSGTVEPRCHSPHPPKSSFIQCLFYPSSPLLISSTTSHWSSPCHGIWTCSMAASATAILLSSISLSHRTSATTNHHSRFNISSHTNAKSHLYRIVSWYPTRSTKISTSFWFFFNITHPSSRMSSPCNLCWYFPTTWHFWFGWDFRVQWRSLAKWFWNVSWECSIRFGEGQGREETYWLSFKEEVNYKGEWLWNQIIIAHYM